MVRLGRDIEKAVLAKGLTYHLQNRVLRDGLAHDRVRLTLEGAAARSPEPRSDDSRHSSRRSGMPAELVTLPAVGRG